jgi:hypothetical protein
MDAIEDLGVPKPGQMEKSDKQTDVIHPENGVNPLQTLKSHSK